MPSPILSIGVDIGGTHISCAAVDLDAGRLLPGSLSRMSYNHEAAADQILLAWATALNSTLAKVAPAPVKGIGFAIPGPFDYRNGVSKMQHKFKHLYDLRIPEALNGLLSPGHDLPMRFLNDASAFGVGEAWLGEGKGYDKVVVITLGTGFGSAFLDRGVPVVLGETVPPEGCLWHLPFRDGIADQYFSTGWFVRENERLGLPPVQGVKELIEKAGDEPVVQDMFVRFGQNLAACLSHWLRRFDAQALVIGGNIAHALPLFGESFKADLAVQGLRLHVAPSALLEEAALLGSARLIDDAFWERVSLHLPAI